MPSFVKNLFRFLLIFSALFIILSFFNSLKPQTSSNFTRVITKNLKQIQTSKSFFLKIVVPFHINQQNTVLDNLDKWKIFKPCILNESYLFNIHLVFYIGYSDSNKNKLKEINDKLPNTIQCFSEISTVLHKYNSSNEDNHVTGSRIMFEYMLDKKYKEFSNAKYVFYMEPDVRAIKSNWLIAIIKEIGNGNFWIKGSVFRGDIKKFRLNDPYLPNYVHINGNAIYKIGDANFSYFYFNILRPYIISKNGDSINAYDTDFFEYLFDKANFENTRHILHNFHFTNLIQNYWQSKYNVLEMNNKFIDTYFVHGGYPIY